MRQMGQFLEKGMKVEVLVAKKKGGKQVDGKEAEAVVKRIRDEIDTVGGREGKPASGAVGATFRMYLEGKKL
jgi:translation initiation factor IF-3